MSGFKGFYCELCNYCSELISFIIKLIFLFAYLVTIPSFQIVRKNNGLQCAVTCNDLCAKIASEIIWFLAENDTILESSKLSSTLESVNYVTLSAATLVKSLKETVRIILHNLHLKMIT